MYQVLFIVTGYLVLVIVCFNAMLMFPGIQVATRAFLFNLEFQMFTLNTIFPLKIIVKFRL